MSIQLHKRCLDVSHSDICCVCVFRKYKPVSSKERDECFQHTIVFPPAVTSSQAMRARVKQLVVVSRRVQERQRVKEYHQVADAVLTWQRPSTRSVAHAPSVVLALVLLIATLHRPSASAAQLLPPSLLHSHVDVRCHWRVRVKLARRRNAAAVQTCPRYLEHAFSFSACPSEVLCHRHFMLRISKAA
jgi:hypothetical protein